MNFSKVILVTACLTAAACGAQHDQTAAKQPETQATAAEPANLPAVLVVKVPVDGSGQELNDQVETRELGAATLGDEAAVASAFAAANSVKVADELDQSSSDEQWRRQSHRWQWRRTSSYGNGCWQGRQAWVAYDRGYGRTYGRPVTPPVYGQPTGPDYGQPGVGPNGQPGFDQPGFGQNNGQPGFGQPGVGQNNGQPGFGQPGVGQNNGQPGVGQPGVGQPGFGQPGVGPNNGQPGVGQPGVGPNNGQPGYGQPTAPIYGQPGYVQYPNVTRYPSDGCNYYVYRRY